MKPHMQHIICGIIPGQGGNIGHVRLNRPEKLNALTPPMCHTLNQQLALWAEDPSIKAVVICGTGDKAFCAGGDLRTIYESQQAYTEARHHFFYDEYAINRRIFHFPKPYIALLHGISMGGGLGIALHGSHRISATSLTLAMPETKIGFYPDIGAGYFLSRCPGQLGRYVGMTGQALNAAEAQYAGLIDHIVPQDAFKTLTREIAISDIKDLDRVIADHAQSIPHDTPLLAECATIDACFQHDTVAEIMEALAANPSPWCQATHQDLQKRSPTSLAVTLRNLQESRHQDFDQCMDRDTYLTEQFLIHSDFYEGIRAVIIDKDHQPRWTPNTLRALHACHVDAYFPGVSR